MQKSETKEPILEGRARMDRKSSRGATVAARTLEQAKTTITLWRTAAFYFEKSR